MEYKFLKRIIEVFSPSYQAAQALILNKKITPSNLEQLIAISEGKAEGSTYDRDVLDYAKTIFKRYREKMDNKLKYKF